MSEQLRKYTAWAREIEARQAKLAASRSGWMRAFAIIAIVSPVGFFWDAWIGGGTLFTGIMFSLFGVYTVVVREREYRRELVQLHKEIARLSAATGATPAAHS